MLTEDEKRAVSLAVVHYGVDSAEADRVVQEVLQERVRGRIVDLLDRFAQAELLDAHQIQDLRRGLEKTQIDLRGMAPAVAPTINLKKLKRLGDFRVLRPIGEGGMGAVLLAFDETKGHQVAIKVLSPDLGRQKAVLERFYREATTGALLDHPNLVKHLGSGLDAPTGLHFLVLEFIEGVTAQDLLDRLGRLPLGDAFHIVREVARALEHAHARNIIHRDIKPANILISDSGQVKLSDLGLAKRTNEASSLTQTKQGFGTPYYMPYEQAMNAKSADARSDIYALGATLYHLLTGAVPFPGDSPVEIVDKKAIGFFLPAGALVTDLPEEVDRILSRTMACDPAGRYQTVTEMLAALDHSNLVAAVPTFFSPERAAQASSQQLVGTGPQPTLLDLRQQSLPETEDLWFVRYRSSKDGWKKAKLTRKEIVRRWREGILSAEAGVSASEKGPYVPLRKVFAEADARHPRLRRARGWRSRIAGDTSQPRLWWIASLGLVTIILSLVGIVVWFMLQ